MNNDAQGNGNHNNSSISTTDSVELSELGEVKMALGRLYKEFKSFKQSQKTESSRDRATGKGTFFRLITALIGEKNTFITTLKQLEENCFEAGAAAKAKLVLITDLSRAYYESLCDTNPLAD